MLMLLFIHVTSGDEGSEEREERNEQLRSKLGDLLRTSP